MTRLLTIQIVGWNGAKHLEATVRALQNAPKDIAEVRYIDNGSDDDSIAIIKKYLPHADILTFQTNQGFAKAHNAGIARCTTPYILTLDQDQEIVWDGIAALLETMQKNPKLGAVQGKLYRKDGNKIIDSAGIIQSLSLNGIERGANEEDNGQYDTEATIIAVTGGCGLYRIEALRDVAYSHNDSASAPHPLPLQGEGNGTGAEYFDADFFAYKEDVDLGWRYIPVLASYHARTLGKRGIFNWGLNPKTIQNRANNFRTRLSLRNYVWMIAKNAPVKQLILHAVFIKARLFVFFILSLCSPQLFSVWGETWRGIGLMRGKGK
jgi:glycosyltransferase involved in cell wall biosynthesis